MIKKLLFFLMVLPALAFSQEFFYPPYYATVDSTDSVLTAPRLLFSNGVNFTGSATIAGFIKCSTAVDSAITPYVRLVMRNYDNLSTKVLYDSSGWHELTAQTGDTWPSAPGATGKPYSFDLSAQDFWKPCAGLELQFTGTNLGNWSKNVSAYLIKVDYK